MDISTKISHLKLRNPTILASGIMDEDFGSMKRVFESGAGAIVTKSISKNHRNGYPNPTIVELETGLLNAMGLPNPGINEFYLELEKLRNDNIPTIGSILGSSPQEFEYVAERMQESGVKAIELNMSCPHAQGYGLELGSDPKIVQNITSTVSESSSVPIFVKISSNLTNVVEIARAIEKGNADGIVAINTVRAMKINLDLQIPILANKIGGYSGLGIKPIGVRCVYEIASNVSLPIIGVGGITTYEDALEYIMAGSCAVQIGSAVYTRGLDVFAKICQGIEEWMKIHGYHRISDLVGVALS